MIYNENNKKTTLVNNNNNKLHQKSWHNNSKTSNKITQGKNNWKVYIKLPNEIIDKENLKNYYRYIEYNKEIDIKNQIDFIRKLFKQQTQMKINFSSNKTRIFLWNKNENKLEQLTISQLTNTLYENWFVNKLDTYFINLSSKELGKNYNNFLNSIYDQKKYFKKNKNEHKKIEKIKEVKKGYTTKKKNIIVFDLDENNNQIKLYMFFSNSSNLGNFMPIFKINLSIYQKLKSWHDVFTIRGFKLVTWQSKVINYLLEYIKNPYWFIKWFSLDEIDNNDLKNRLEKINKKLTDWKLNDIETHMIEI